METYRNKTVFIEYSYSEKGQSFITVVYIKNHERVITGRIYREYDSATNKTKYLATDFIGNRVFVDSKSLSELKNNFIEHGESLAMFIPKNPNKSRQEGRLVYILQAERNKALQNIRDKKSDKIKTNEITKPNSKTNENQKEKEQDSRNIEEYKVQPNEQSQISKNSEESSNKNILSEVEINQLAEEGCLYAEEERIEMEEIEKSAREIELDNIREQNEDREEDLEIDL